MTTIRKLFTTAAIFACVAFNANGQWVEREFTDPFDGPFKNIHVQSSKYETDWKLLVISSQASGRASVALKETGAFNGFWSIMCEPHDLTILDILDGEQTKVFHATEVKSGEGLLYFQNGERLYHRLKNAKELILRVNGCGLENETMFF